MIPNNLISTYSNHIVSTATTSPTNSCTTQALSEDYADFIVGSFSPYNRFFNFENRCIAEMTISEDVIYSPIKEVLPLSIIKYPYSTIPDVYGLLNSTALENSGILRLQNQPVLQLKGQGIVIGIIDTGIDYTHEAFLDNAGRTRIISIWDQSDTSGTPPERQFYGTEYTSEMINQALLNDNPFDIVPTIDDNGHGTFMAGVAGGSESVENGFIGVAPLAEFIVVKLKPAKQYLRDYYFIKDDAICYQENDIIFAISYITDKCLALGKPLSLVMGLGNSKGIHKGISNLSFTLNRLTENTGNVVVTAMGNEGNKRLHFSGNVSDNITPSVMEIRIDERQKGLMIEIWGQNPQVFSVSVISPTGEVLERVPPRLNTSENYTFLFEHTTIQLEYKLVESASGEQLILIRLINPTSGIWRINVYGESNFSGSFNAWLPLSNFLYENTYFLSSTPDSTLTSPADAAGPISVSNYDAVTNSLSIESGRGNFNFGVNKPDIASPGVNMLGPRAGGGYTVKSGSSISAAVTAGAAAQFLTWGITENNQPELKNSDIKGYLIRGATRLSDSQYPNNSFGYGTLQIYNSFEIMRGNS